MPGCLRWRIAWHEHRAPAGLDDVHAAYVRLLWHVAESEGQGGRGRGGGRWAVPM